MKQIYFYKTSSGKDVVSEFIDKLDNTIKVRVRNGIRLLAKHVLELLRNKSVKKILRRPDIFELRIVGKTQIRLLFMIYNKDIFLLVHIFIKKTQKTPLRDIRLAQKRVKEFI